MVSGYTYAAAILLAAASSNFPTSIEAFGGLSPRHVSLNTYRTQCTSWNFGAKMSATATEVETTDIFMPALSSTMTEGKIVQWLKEEGDAVSAGEAIMVVESDKADMDVEAFEDGFLAKIVVAEGEQAEVGARVGIIVANESDIAAVQSGAVASSTAPAPAAPDAKAVPAAPATDAVAEPTFEFSRIDMPALSSTMKEGKIVSWLKSEGDPVSSGEAIMVVESDKADMDVEAFEDGFLAAIVIEEGDSGAVGAPVAYIAAEETDVAATAAPAAAAPKAKAAPAPATASAGGRVVASPLAKKRAAELGLDISLIVGTGPGGRITGGDVEKAAAAGTASAGSKPAPKAAAEPSKPKHIPAAGVIPATPMAKELAKKKKIDIFSIKGTGNFGRVTLEDVKAAIGEAPKKKSAPVRAGSQPVELPDGLKPFTGMQRAVSNNMEKSLSVPIFRVSREIITDNFDDLYQKVKPKGVSVSALLAKAVALAVEKHPIMNSSFDPSGGIMYKSDINIAMAVAIDGGLITPTIQNANEKPIMEIGEIWRQLVEKAKTGSLSPAEYQSGTFTISNLGMFGVSQFDAILPPGQGSILAIGGTQQVVVPDKASILGLKTVKKMTVTLTCDHRPIYGADAALFLKTLADIMENKVEQLLL